MTQQEFWNKKFDKDEFFYGIKPNSFIEKSREYYKDKKTVLCLGEGEGRNAIFLAKKGLKVEAIDASNIGLEKLEKTAQENKLNIKTVCMDLNKWKVDKSYDLIVASYLHMHVDEREILFKKIEQALNKDALFIAEFFSTNQLNYSSGGPKDIDLLYTKEDFLNSFENCEKYKVEELETYLDEGKGHQGKASVIRVIIKKLA